MTHIDQILTPNVAGTDRELIAFRIGEQEDRKSVV